MRNRAIGAVFTAAFCAAVVVFLCADTDTQVLEAATPELVPEEPSTGLLQGDGFKDYVADGVPHANGAGSGEQGLTAKELADQQAQKAGRGNWVVVDKEMDKAEAAYSQMDDGASKEAFKQEITNAKADCTQYKMKDHYVCKQLFCSFQLFCQSHDGGHQKVDSMCDKFKSTDSLMVVPTNVTGPAACPAQKFPSSPHDPLDGHTPMGKCKCEHAKNWAYDKCEYMVKHVDRACLARYRKLETFVAKEKAHKKELIEKSVKRAAEREKQQKADAKEKSEKADAKAKKQEEKAEEKKNKADKKKKKDDEKAKEKQEKNVRRVKKKAEKAYKTSEKSTKKADAKEQHTKNQLAEAQEKKKKAEAKETSKKAEEKAKKEKKKEKKEKKAEKEKEAEEEKEKKEKKKEKKEEKKEKKKEKKQEKTKEKAEKAMESLKAKEKKMKGAEKDRDKDEKEEKAAIKTAEADSAAIKVAEEADQAVDAGTAAGDTEGVHCADLAADADIAAADCGGFTTAASTPNAHSEKNVAENSPGSGSVIVTEVEAGAHFPKDDDQDDDIEDDLSNALSDPSADDDALGVDLEISA